MNQIKMLSLDDLTGRPLVDLLLVKTIHFYALFRDNPLDEAVLEHIDYVLRHKLVYLLTTHGHDATILAEELDAWRGLVPHRWAEANPGWANIFKTYADTLASAGAVAANRTRHDRTGSFLAWTWKTLERTYRMHQRAELMRRNCFTLIGEEKE